MNPADPRELRRLALQAAIDASPAGYGWDNGRPVGDRPRKRSKRLGYAVQSDRPGERWPSKRAAARALGVTEGVVRHGVRNGRPVAGRVLRVVEAEADADGAAPGGVVLRAC